MKEVFDSYESILINSYLEHYLTITNEYLKKYKDCTKFKHLEGVLNFQPRETRHFGDLCSITLPELVSFNAKEQVVSRSEKADEVIKEYCTVSAKTGTARKGLELLDNVAKSLKRLQVYCEETNMNTRLLQYDYKLTREGMHDWFDENFQIKESLLFKFIHNLNLRKEEEVLT